LSVILQSVFGFGAFIWVGFVVAVAQYVTVVVRLYSFTRACMR